MSDNQEKSTGHGTGPVDQLKGVAKSKQYVFPSIQDQQKIVQYLDQKTQQIDSLIEKHQKKIELLKEQRTSLINQVLTKGLNPDESVGSN